MRKTLSAAALVTFCAIVFSSSVALAGGNWLGTWKMNPAKSKYSPGPAPKSLTIQWEQTADGIKLTSDLVTADGNPAHGEYLSKFDGADVPWTGNPDADTASAKKIDDNAFENTWKKGGKATIRSDGAVSKDGKTLTIKMTGTNAKGEKVNNKVVYDRQ